VRERLADETHAVHAARLDARALEAPASEIDRREAAELARIESTSLNTSGFRFFAASSIGR
jgi:hypothetical protein